MPRRHPYGRGLPVPYGSEVVGRMLLGQSELSEVLMRALELKGDLPQHIDANFQAGVNVLDLTAAEYQYLRRVSLLSQGINLPAVAAQFSQAAFAPLAGFNRSMCVVEKLVLSNTNPGAVTYFIDSVPFGAAPVFNPGNPKSSRDDRNIPFAVLQPTPGFGLVDQTNAVSISGTGSIPVTVAPGSCVILDVNYVFTNRNVINLLPSYLKIGLSAVNLAANFGLFWRERAIATSELL